MNIFRYELKQNSVSAVYWIIGLLLMSSAFLAVFAVIIKDTNIVINMDGFPESFKKAFGFTDNTFSSFPSLYAMLLHLIMLIGSLQAMNLGLNTTVKEIRDRTAEFLFTKPIKRASILTQKLSAALCAILITNVVYLAATWWFIQNMIDDPFTFETFMRSSLTLFFIQLFFLILGALIGIAIPKIKTVIAVTLPTVFALYFFSLFDTIIGEDKIKYLTPFKFFDVDALVTGDQYQTASIIYLAALLVIATAASYRIFQNKDLHII